MSRNPFALKFLYKYTYVLDWLADWASEGVWNGEDQLCGIAVMCNGVNQQLHTEVFTHKIPILQTHTHQYVSIWWSAFAQDAPLLTEILHRKCIGFYGKHKQNDACECKSLKWVFNIYWTVSTCFYSPTPKPMKILLSHCIVNVNITEGVVCFQWNSIRLQCNIPTDQPPLK